MHQPAPNSRVMPQEACNDRPSQVSVAPRSRFGLLPGHAPLQRSPKSGFRCTTACRSGGRWIGSGLQRSPKSGFRCTQPCWGHGAHPQNALQRSPKSGFRCTNRSAQGPGLGFGLSCNDRPSQVSVAPCEDFGLRELDVLLQRSPKSGFRCTLRGFRIA